MRINALNPYFTLLTNLLTESNEGSEVSVGEGLEDEDFVPHLNEQIKLLFDKAAAGKSSIEGISLDFNLFLFDLFNII